MFDVEEVEVDCHEGRIGFVMAAQVEVIHIPDIVAALLGMFEIDLLRGRDLCIDCRNGIGRYHS